MSFLASPRETQTPEYALERTTWPQSAGRVPSDVLEWSVLLPRTPVSESSIALEETKPWQEEIEVSTVRSLELQVSWVKQFYAFRRSQEVSRFLQAHPFLVPLLLEAYGEIDQYFGPSPDVVLEVITDPESENDRELFALVQTELSPDDALHRLDRFDQEWWLDASPQACCLLNIDVEYA